MNKFRIQPHGRLQEWVAEEKGYYTNEGLEYEFIFGARRQRTGDIETTEETSAEVREGAFESMEAGRACEVSAACHWAVNMASSAQHGRMWGHAYSVTPSAIYVPPESPIRNAEELRNVEIGVGYHSGSHFSTLQSVEKFLRRDEIKLRFIGGHFDRLDLLFERKVTAGNVFGAEAYALEQQGFRKVLDTTFMIGFLITGDAAIEDVEKYFRALQRAQRDIDQEPERYKHYFLKELPDKYHSLVDVRAFGPGERLVFEPYTQEVYEKTHRWIESWNLFDEAQAGQASYEAAVLT
jgi:NitT/TauT family transport system substrate-binding protein